MTHAKTNKVTKIVRVVALLLPTIAIFLLAEWMSAVYLKEKYGDDFNLKVQATGEMAPSGYQLWEHPANYWNWLKLNRYNNMGFRRLEDTTVSKPKGVIRIFVMGGSGALGSSANPGYPWLQMSGQAQYEMDETISGYLEKLLNDKYPDRTYEVINAATNWSQIHQQLIHYLRKIRFLDPDLVISIDGQNDAWGIEDDYLSAWDKSSRVKLLNLTSNIRVKVRPLISNSHFLFLVAATTLGENKVGRQPIDQALVEKYAALGKPDDYDKRVEDYFQEKQNFVKKTVGLYLSELQHFYDALQRQNTNALFIQQPQLLMDETKPLTKIETALKNYIHNDGFDAFAHNFWIQLEKDGSTLRDTEDVPFYPFLNIFGEETGEVYVDYTHLTPRGNEILARRLMSLIEGRYPSLISEP